MSLIKITKQVRCLWKAVKKLELSSGGNNSAPAGDKNLPVWYHYVNTDPQNGIYQQRKIYSTIEGTDITIEKASSEGNYTFTVPLDWGVDTNNYDDLVVQFYGEIFNIKMSYIVNFIAGQLQVVISTINTATGVREDIRTPFYVKITLLLP